MRVQRFRAGCWCGWESGESMSREWAEQEARVHQDYLTQHLTFISWRTVSGRRSMGADSR